MFMSEVFDSWDLKAAFAAAELAIKARWEVLPECPETPHERELRDDYAQAA